MKDSKELVIGLLAIAALLAEKLKDGVQVADIGEIVAKIAADEVLKAKIEAAYVDIEKVPSEVQAATVSEVVEILAAALPEVLNLINAVKK